MDDDAARLDAPARGGAGGRRGVGRLDGRVEDPARGAVRGLVEAAVEDERLVLGLRRVVHPSVALLVRDGRVVLDAAAGGDHRIAEELLVEADARRVEDGERLALDRLEAAPHVDDAVRALARRAALRHAGGQLARILELPHEQQRVGVRVVGVRAEDGGALVAPEAAGPESAVAVVARRVAPQEVEADDVLRANRLAHPRLHFRIVGREDLVVVLERDARRPVPEFKALLGE